MAEHNPDGPRQLESALVIGGTGFIGCHTVAELLAHDYHVTTMSRGEQPLQFEDGRSVPHVAGDRSDLDTLRDAARQADPTADDDHRAWARSFSAGMDPYTTDGVYVNFLSRESDERVEAAYGDNHERLTAVKAKYDPENLFRMNQNVEPT